ncbi:MAG TPA: YdeI/OmpD-associated family protein [Candidatus Limnocylindria bacterium]|nr:YdeI/OmpD-associated family protein [Candidatus Limnocylindria bacterium]
MAGRPVTTTTTLTGEGGEYYFIVPVDFRAEFGRHRPPVKVTIRGHTFRTTPARYGTEYYVVVNRANREAIGIDRGDRVRIRFELDTEPRVIEPPPELAASLAGSRQARAIFDKLAYSHQKAYADWVTEAKRPETRVRRAAESVKRLLAGRKEPNG